MGTRGCLEGPPPAALLHLGEEEVSSTAAGWQHPAQRALLSALLSGGGSRRLWSGWGPPCPALLQEGAGSRGPSVVCTEETKAAQLAAQRGPTCMSSRPIAMATVHGGPLHSFPHVTLCICSAVSHGQERSAILCRSLRAAVCCRECHQCCPITALCSENGSLQHSPVPLSPLLTPNPCVPQWDRGMGEPIFPRQRWDQEGLWWEPAGEQPAPLPPLCAAL